MKSPVHCALVHPSAELIDIRIHRRTYSCKSQLHQRSLVNLLDLLLRPIIPWSIGTHSFLESRRLRGSILCRGGRNSAISSDQRLTLALLKQSSGTLHQALRSMSTHDGCIDVSPRLNSIENRDTGKQTQQHRSSVKARRSSMPRWGQIATCHLA